MAMNKLFLISLILSNTSFAYDSVIKDNKGRITGYLDTQGDRTYKVDKSGRKGDYIKSDGAIKDSKGRTKGYLKKDGNRTYYTDTKGRRSGSYIELDGTIKNKYGRKTGKIDKK